MWIAGPPSLGFGFVSPQEVHGLIHDAGLKPGRIRHTGCWSKASRRRHPDRQSFDAPAFKMSGHWRSRAPFPLPHG
jgi:hypothetical protein